MQLITFPSQHLTIAAGRFFLRPVEEKDYKALFHFIKNNAGIFRGPFPITVEAILKDETSAKKWIREKIEAWRENRSMVCVAEDEEQHKIVFFTSAFNFDWRVPKCEMAWMLDDAYEKKGLATTFTQIVVDFLMDSCGVNKLVCRIEPDNERSAALAKRLGFEQEGIHKNDFRDGNDRLVNVAYFGLLRKNDSLL